MSIFSRIKETTDKAAEKANEANKKSGGLLREVLALDEVKNPEEDLTREQAVKEAQAKREAEAAEAAKAELAASVDEALAEKEAEEALADAVAEETEAKAEAPEAAEPAEDESKEAAEAAEPARPETKETEPVESEAPEVTEPEPAPAVSEPESAPKTEVVSNPEPPRGGQSVKSLDFYNTLGEKAHQADSTGHMSEELEDYVLETLEKWPDLIDQVIRENLEAYLKKNPVTVEAIVAGNFKAYLEKNPGQLDEVAEAIRDVADTNIEVGLKYVNKVDKTEFDNWVDACASIEDKTRYGIDPNDVFQKKYYWKKHPDVELSEDDVRGYVDKFNGHKDILIKKLQLEQQAKRSKKAKGSKPDKAKAQNKAK